MLRFRFFQHWFYLPDFADEEALYDMASLRRLVGIYLESEAITNATTLLKFRNLLERHNLNEKLFTEVGRVLQGSRMTLKSTAIVDAIIMVALSSTENAEKNRDPEMHRTRNGKQRHFDMKLYLGMDGRGGLAYVPVVTSAIVHDKRLLSYLSCGQEQRIYGDSAYVSQQNLIRSKALQAKNKSLRRACLRGWQAVVGFYETALPLPWEKRRSRICRVGTGQYLLVSKSIDGRSAAIVTNPTSIPK